MQSTMADPDHSWKPTGRPQSTVALNFMSELDDLFKMDGGLDLLDKNVHQKKQAVSTHAQQLEELEARLRETEERLKQAKSSPPRPKDGQRRTPTESAFPDNAKAHIGSHGSPLAMRRKPQADTQAAKDTLGALPDTPTSDNSTERFVMVDRPPTAQTDEGEKA